MTLPHAKELFQPCSDPEAFRYLGGKVHKKIETARASLKRFPKNAATQR